LVEPQLKAMYVSFTMDNCQTLNTSLGTIHFSAHAKVASGSVFEVALRVLELEPSLPSHMSVRRVRAVLLVAFSDTGFERLDYRCRLLNSMKGGPESGERLDAVSWVGERELVMVGTEDGEALSSRMPWLEFEGYPQALVEYHKDGLNVPLQCVPAGVTVSLHYVIAENSNPEPAACSSWFAVDVPHERVLMIGS